MIHGGHIPPGGIEFLGIGHIPAANINPGTNATCIQATTF